MNTKSKSLIVLVLAFGLALLAGALVFVSGRGKGSAGTNGTVKVLSYSSFVSSWGPGPEIARLFKEQTGLDVLYQDAGDAGLLLQKLSLFPADVVLGFDQLSLEEARKARKWRLRGQWETGAVVSETRFSDSVFIAFDWSPVAFVYRQNQIEPPKSLDDLLAPRFEKSLALEDPRTSSPGLQFLYWVLDEKGIDAGFAFLEKLKPNVHSVSAGWSEAYGTFTKGLSSSAFSYLTSPLYHLIEEKDPTYAAAIFPSGHPVQVEYAAIPASCENCKGAELFAKFLLTANAQKIIMQKNYMLPVTREAATGTPFETLMTSFESGGTSSITVREWKNLNELQEKRDELFKRWNTLGL